MFRSKDGETFRAYVATPEVNDIVDELVHPFGVSPPDILGEFVKFAIQPCHFSMDVLGPEKRKTEELTEDMRDLLLMRRGAPLKVAAKPIPRLDPAEECLCEMEPEMRVKSLETYMTNTEQKEGSNQKRRLQSHEKKILSVHRLIEMTNIVSFQTYLRFDPEKISFF